MLQNQDCESDKVLQEAFGLVRCGVSLQST
nr:MAG TPA: hypothetical protein [Caudoviricetes sp.]DAG22434.1 MAG TPA: hypothetical protein [Caudoviricetes sp.]DAH23633.1 MAG TPA: hypothetical protein [Caudoviricetes sp.]DAW39997.1 MAG TPA: hypothetical protein [Caudoviricetes sp.]DAX37743.1 MAG TPA: hypothetical protein [Caudoviricetes sp.]